MFAFAMLGGGIAIFSFVTSLVNGCTKRFRTIYYGHTPKYIKRLFLNIKLMEIKLIENGVKFKEQSCSENTDTSVLEAYQQYLLQKLLVFDVKKFIWLAINKLADKKYKFQIMEQFLKKHNKEMKELKMAINDTGIYGWIDASTCIMENVSNKFQENHQQQSDELYNHPVNKIERIISKLLKEYINIEIKHE